MQPRSRNRSAAAALFVGLALPVAAAPAGGAVEMALNAATYPEGRSVDVAFGPTNRATKEADLSGVVTWTKTAAKVSLRIRRSEPAVLFGGDVTCYVAWAVTPDGEVENLGELPVQGGGGSAGYRTARSTFALIVTAEAHPGTPDPSPIVVAVSTAPDPKFARNKAFAFSGFSKQPVRTDFESIASLKWTGAEDSRIVEARRTLDVAARAGAEKAAGAALAGARQLLAQAESSARSGRRREAVDYAQRSLALSRGAVIEAEKTRAEEAAALKNR